jgi:ADP-heptose:LPS heptosyltransferase
MAHRAQEGDAVRFLIARLSSLGDVVCTLPAAVALKSSYPDAEVVWCVGHRFAGAVELCRAVSEVVVWPKHRAEQKRVLDGLGEFDAAFDLQGLWKSGALVGKCKAKSKLGYFWQREGSWLFSQCVRPDPSSLHVTDQYVDVVRAYGAEADRAEFGLAPDPADIATVRALLPPGELVVCNAGAGWATKRWPPSHFAALANALHERGLRVAFVGAKGDRGTMEEVKMAGATNAFDLVGRTDVRQLVALLSIARAHVGGDTGSTHIAAALGVPAIGLYSVTRPERSCPYGQRHNTLHDPRGLAHIPVEAVLEKLTEAIRQNG